MQMIAAMAPVSSQLQSQHGLNTAEVAVIGVCLVSKITTTLESARNPAQLAHGKVQKRTYTQRA
jgi:hypothetical protein